MKINSKTLKCKITCTRLAFKVQCEYTVYTTTLLTEEICKDIFISKQTTDNTNNSQINKNISIGRHLKIIRQYKM